MLASVRVLGLVATLVGCATSEPNSGETPLAVQGTDSESDSDPDDMEDKDHSDVAAESRNEQEIDTVIASVDDRIEEEDLQAESQGGPTPDDTGLTQGQKITLEMNADVQRWIDYFSVKDKERFQRFLERGERFKPQVLAVLKDQGIPPEIFYQAMIESGFATAATSRAAAVGIWQFIGGTGRRYGLRVDAYVDERRDPMRATIAAALYLKDLYNVFQSWYLAMAAYNAGEGRIMGAIMRAKTRDFWEMAKQRALPEETINYVPKFLAAAMIGRNPKKFGFDLQTTGSVPPLVSVPVPSPVKLSDIANLSGIPVETLREHNPHLMRGLTPPGVATYRIWVPKTQALALEGIQESLVQLKVKSVQVAAVSQARPHYHVVGAGETLARIAAMYGISVKQLRRLNHIKHGRIVQGTRLVLWKEAAEPGSSLAKPSSRYKVKRGDNLDSIARRFGVTVEDLKRLNRIKRGRVYVGQILRLGDQKG